MTTFHLITGANFERVKKISDKLEEFRARAEKELALLHSEFWGEITAVTGDINLSEKSRQDWVLIDKCESEGIYIVEKEKKRQGNLLANLFGGGDEPEETAKTTPTTH